MFQNTLVTTYDCGDIATKFLHKETKLTRRKFDYQNKKFDNLNLLKKKVEQFKHF